MAEPEPVRDYPTYDEIRHARIEARRQAALVALRKAEAIAHAHGGRIVVFGSLAEGGFTENSDIDVAVLDLPPGPDLELAVEIDTAISLAGFSVDVSPLRFLPPSLRERVAEHGREPSALG